MNNVEALEDFLKLLRKVHPNVEVSQRDEFLFGMAINHAYLIKRQEIAELEEELTEQKEITEIWKGRYLAENEKLLKIIE